MVGRARWAQKSYPDPEPSGGGGGGSLYSVVYQPGGVPRENLYADFNLLYAASVALQGGLRVVVDDSITSPAVIPAKTGGGSYSFADWHFDGVPNFSTSSGGAALQFASGVSISPQTTIWFSSLDVTFVGTAPCIDVPSSDEANLYLYSVSLSSTSTGPFAKADAGGFVEVVSNSSLIGDGTHTTLLGNTGGNMFVQAYDGTTVAASATDASVAGGTLIRHDASSNVHTQPGNVTVSFADDAYRVGYDPGEPADWTTAPTNVGDALDELAAKEHDQNVNFNTASSTASPVTLTDTTNPYVPGDGAKAVLVSITFSGTVTGENGVTVQPMRGLATLGISSLFPADASGRFGGCVTVLDTTSPPSSARYALKLTSAAGNFTVGASSVQFDKVDV